MRIPPKRSRFVTNAPTKSKRVVRWRTTKHTPKSAPESVLYWRELGWLATLLLAAVVFTVLLFARLAVEEDRGDGNFVDGNFVDGEVAVVDGEVGVVDSDGNRVSPKPSTSPNPSSPP
jgi:hypothetical protein